MTEEELHRDPDAAAEMAANAVLHYLRGCGVRGHEEAEKWIQKVCERAISKLAH